MASKSLDNEEPKWWQRVAIIALVVVMLIVFCYQAPTLYHKLCEILRDISVHLEQQF